MTILWIYYEGLATHLVLNDEGRDRKSIWKNGGGAVFGARVDVGGEDYQWVVVWSLHEVRESTVRFYSGMAIRRDTTGLVRNVNRRKFQSHHSDHQLSCSFWRATLRIHNLWASKLLKRDSILRTETHFIPFGGGQQALVVKVTIQGTMQRLAIEWSIPRDH